MMFRSEHCIPHTVPCLPSRGENMKRSHSENISFFLFQSAKMFNYAGWRKTCNCMFTMFAAVFIVTRLVILPFW